MMLDSQQMAESQATAPQMTTPQTTVLKNIQTQIGAVIEQLTQLQTMVQSAIKAEVGTPIPLLANSQRDPRWAAVKLGWAKSNVTLGSDGCLITCLASAVNKDPNQMNDYLKERQMFVPNPAGEYVRLVLDCLQGLGLKLGEIDDCPTTPANVGKIRQALLDNKLVVAKVKRAGVPEHWLRILAVTDDGQDATILDPWNVPGENVWGSVTRYGSDLKTALLRVLYYVKTPITG